MNSDDWIARCTRQLAERREHAQLRQRQTVRPIDAVHLEIDGVTYVNFSSNNYLGLTHHPRVLAALADAAIRSGAGSGAAALISGYADAHQSCEATLAGWKGTEAAVVLPSGYQANLAAIQTIAAIGESYPSGLRFLADKLVHASLIDAVRATQAPLRVFPHNGLTKLNRLLEESDPQQLQVVLTESIFSMDGDACDLRGIAELKSRTPFLLLLDEAHASGVHGPGGAGVAAELGLQQAVDVSIVTLSKAIGCAGGAVCCSAIFRDALINFGRAYIYSTSIAPAQAASVQAAIAVMRDEPQRQARVRELARRVRDQFGKLETRSRDFTGDSPIIPIVLGSEEAALKAAELLRVQQMLVGAVRPPTVAPGSSRLRVTLSCAHTDDEVDRLVTAVRQVLAQIS
jgi:8-amino-7-oxononanoate synthase